MAIIYSSAVKDSRMQAVVTALGGTSKLEICTAGYASILATISLDATAGTVSSGVLTISGLPKQDVSADNTGIAAVARFRTGANVDVITGLTVGESAADIIIDNTDINAGQTIVINSATITHA